MKFSSGVFQEVSGSAGGYTYSRARGGGMYIRARALVTNPNSPRQQTVRSALSAAVVAWQNVLSEGQRDGWRVYASNTPLTDAIGNSTLVTGLNMYIRQYVLMTQAAEAPLVLAPTVFDLGTPPSIVVAPEATVTAGIAAEVVPPDAAGITAAFLGRPQNAAINFYKGPYRFLGSSTDGTFGVSTANVLAQTEYAITDGLAYFMRFVNVDADGRVSSDTRTRMVATAGV